MEKNPFITHDGKIVKDINELYQQLSQMEQDVFNRHVNPEKNDFSSWLSYIGMNEAAEAIRPFMDIAHTSRIIRQYTDRESKKLSCRHAENAPVSQIGMETASSPENKAFFVKEDNNVAKSGIKEFDRILNPGIPKGSIVLVSGNAGTGKTTFAMQWLYNGANLYDEPGLYFALTEPITKTIKNISNFSFYSNNSKVHLSDFRSVLRLLNLHDRKLGEKDTGRILNVLKEVAEKSNAKRIVIDSVTALCYLLEEKNLIRNFIFHMGNLLNELKCTIMLTSEVSKEAYSVFGVEEFISDGIILLEQRTKNDDMFRTIQIAKMRGLVYSPELNKFRITTDGIHILEKVKPELDYISSNKIVTSGIKGLDKMLGGGLLEGSTTLIAGSAGLGKSIITEQFIYDGLKQGEKCLLVSFEESREQITRNAANIGCSLKKYIDSGQLRMINAYPGSRLPEEHMLSIAESVESSMVKRCVIDSISALTVDFSKEELSDFFKKLNVYLKSKQVTTLFTYATTADGERPNWFNLQSTTDNIIILKFVEIDSEMRLMIGVLKTRGTSHENKLREYVIDNKGIVLKSPFKDIEGLFTGKTSKTVDKKLVKAFEELARGQ